MSLLDVYADQLKTASANEPFRAPQPTAKASAWTWTGIGTAPTRGMAAGAAESAGFMADVLGAFGQAAATIPSGSMFGPDMDPAQTEQARQKMLKGIDYSSEAGDLFRGVSRGYKPDPETASFAESLLFDLSRFATKAVGYSITGGPVVGAVATAADEGLTVADDLRQQGVDLATRTKVGAVQGVAAGAGVLLPVAGRSLAQTAALVAAGGPASYAASSYLSRQILQEADYSKVAQQFDPFDPVGLAVSTIIPAAFGGYALRRARMRGVAPENTAPEAFPSERTPVAQAVQDAYRVTPDDVDVARVAMQTEQRRTSTIGDPEDMSSMARHEEALSRAEEQMARGEPVQVADVAPIARISAAERDVNFKAWFGDSKVVDAEGKPLVVYHGTRANFDSFDKSATRNVGAFPDAEGFYFTPTAGDAAGYATGRFGGDGEGASASVMPVHLALKNPKVLSGGMEHTYISPRQLAEYEAQGYDGLIFRADDPRSDEYVAFRPEQIKSAIGNSGRFDPNSPSLTDPLDELSSAIASGLRAMKREADALTPPRVAADSTPTAPEAPKNAAETTATSPAAPAAGASDSSVSGTGVDPAQAGRTQQRLAQVQAQYPDLMVQVDGMDAPMRLSEFLDAVRAEADAERADAPDFLAAAECAITNGLG